MLNVDCRLYFYSQKIPYRILWVAHPPLVTSHFPYHRLLLLFWLFLYLLWVLNFVCQIPFMRFLLKVCLSCFTSVWFKYSVWKKLFHSFRNLKFVFRSCHCSFWRLLICFLILAFAFLVRKKCLVGSSSFSIIFLWFLLLFLGFHNFQFPVSFFRIVQFFECFVV